MTTYTYDGLNRLSSATEKVGTTTNAKWEFTYDAAGNRLTQQLTGDTGHTTGTITYDYNAANQIIDTSRDTGTWSYDDGGNQTTDGLRAHTATYGDRGNVASIAGTSYSSVGQGNDNLVAAGTRSFLNTQLGTTGISTTSTSQSITRDSVGGAIQYTDTAGGHHFYALDNLDSVVGMFNDSGVWEGGYSYSPYGETRHAATATSVVGNPLRYISGQYEGDERYKLGSRIYDAQTGRFTQMDPSGQEKNPYAYSACNPINSSDASGRLTQCGVLGAIAGVSAFVAGVAGAYLALSAPADFIPVAGQANLVIAGYVLAAAGLFGGIAALDLVILGC